MAAVSLALREFSRSVARAKVTLRFREYMIKKTLSLPLSYYDKNMADQLISRTTLDTTMLSFDELTGSGYTVADYEGYCHCMLYYKEK